jgi:opacity protein-like surface antigen
MSASRKIMRRLGRRAPVAGAAVTFGLAATGAVAQTPAPVPNPPGFMAGFDSGHFYIGGAGGYSILQDIAVAPHDGPLGPGPATERFGPGFIGAGDVGYAFSNGVQIDVLGAYNQNYFNNLVKVTGTGRQGGYANSYGGFLEAFYAFDLPKFGIPVSFFSPYLGVGAGALWTHANAPEVLSTGSVNYIGGTSGPNFAYEAIAGVAVPIAGVPGLSLTADYRLIGIHDASDLRSTFYNSGAGVFVRGGIGLQPDIFDHVFTVGLAYAFGVEAAAPAPAAEPAPVAAPARSYLVFFDWDRATLTGRARQIIHQAADNSTRVQYTRIEVNGYTDTSGTPRYNQGLSIRRAEAVAAELVRDGVPRAAISIQGFGETHLLVPTGPGVREPQNRRVEIIIQ